MPKIELDLDAITARMDELKNDRARYKFELANVEKEIEKEELKLIALLDKTGVDEMQHRIYSWGWKITKRKAFDQQLFSFEHPDMFEDYKIEKENKKLEFRINK
jgi:hypothetical protein